MTSLEGKIALTRPPDFPTGAPRRTMCPSPLGSSSIAIRSAAARDHRDQLELIDLPLLKRADDLWGDRIRQEGPERISLGDGGVDITIVQQWHLGLWNRHLEDRLWGCWERLGLGFSQTAKAEHRDHKKVSVHANYI